jgi:CRP-like cAMP-binding protein
LKTFEIVVFWLALNLLFAKDLLSVLLNHALNPVRPWLNRKKTLHKKELPKPTESAILAQLQEISLFESFPKQHLAQLISQSEWLAIEAGQLLVAQGDLGNDMFVLLEGELRVSRQLSSGLVETLTHLHRQAIFGGVADTQEVFLGVDVEAVKNSVVLRIGKSVINVALQALSGDHESKKVMDQRRTLAQAIAQSAFFKDLPKELTNLFFSSTSEFLQPVLGSKIITEGQESDDFYVVIEGSVTVSKSGQTMATISAGQFFGEMALLHSRKRTADVIANEACMLLKIPAAVFYDMLAMNWGLALNIDLMATKRGVVLL